MKLFNNYQIQTKLLFLQEMGEQINSLTQGDSPNLIAYPFMVENQFYG